MYYFIAFLLYLLFIVYLFIRNIKTFLDLEFYKLHKLKLVEVFVYKSLEILLIDQYIRRYSKKTKEQIARDITVDMLYLYNKYFKSITVKKDEKGI